MPTQSSSQAQLIDISIQLSPTTVTFPGDPPLQIEVAKSLDPNQRAVVHRISMGSHAGTHIDAPAHVIRGGMPLQKVSLEPLIGECIVVDCLMCDRSIDAPFLEAQELPRRARVLLKTTNSGRLSLPRFDPDYVCLTPDGAEFLVGLDTLLVGIDYLSIGKVGPLGLKTHRSLLSAGVVILEGLNLSSVRPGKYELICLPMKLDVPDGAPARALLRGRS